MKSTKIISTLLFIFLLLISSCQKDDDGSGGGERQENIPDTFSEYFGNNISRDFLGNVIDTDHNPIEGVTITIGNQTAITDNNGVFIIRDANVNERFGYVKAKKAGYIHGSRSIVPSNGTNKITIMLLDATVTGTVSSGNSGIVTASDGSSVSFDGNFIKEDGSAYSGSVDVIMHHLDSADEDMSMQMPGMLYAENEDGAERMLQTLGMLAVELRGSGGEDLNLAEGSTSEIKIPVDASLISIAPATIPLWYFDEANGYWKEEGTATLQGNMYVGNVSHFSFWNCDIPAEAVNLCITITDNEGNLLSNLYLPITSEAYGTRSGYTNDIGEVCGLVPSNESLELNVYSYNICGDAQLFTQTVGPFNADASISITLPENADFIEETVTGNFNTCSGDAVTDGYLQLSYGNQTFIDIVSDGTFEINLARCSVQNTFNISGIDYANTQRTGSINYTFTTPETNLGQLSACNSAIEFIQYSIDNNNSVIDTDIYSANFNTNGGTFPLLSILSNLISDPDGFILFRFNLSDNPSYTGEYMLEVGGDSGSNTNRLSLTMENASILLFYPNFNSDVIGNITSFGEVGEYIDINFSGTYEDYFGDPHTITGVVHVLRDE
ncbi:carboxypeptidase-like regulatory domain-containing protein [uncultured Winogradskyella sp.]|uniref:carboxypeptidase-like regulatory domain-containing protein n=1 Tax=uncultured Winogradskyella sp. TaxID=395353 RepID=UPI00261E0452|nr:carboxypeptidase-like regulatory domain-containing protein [uncultured Winogradskyella sp.]